MTDHKKSTLAFFERMTTDQLARIWKRNDRTAWTEDAFVAVGQILRQRQIPLPNQDPAIERGVLWFPRPAFLEPRPYDCRARRLIAYESVLLASVALWIILGLLGVL